MSDWRTLERLVLDLQAHAKECGWQDVDEPIAALLAWQPPAASAALDGYCAICYHPLDQCSHCCTPDDRP